MRGNDPFRAEHLPSGRPAVGARRPPRRTHRRAQLYPLRSRRRRAALAVRGRPVVQVRQHARALVLCVQHGASSNCSPTSILNCKITGNLQVQLIAFVPLTTHIKFIKVLTLANNACARSI